MQPYLIHSYIKRLALKKHSVETRKTTKWVKISKQVQIFIIKIYIILEVTPEYLLINM